MCDCCNQFNASLISTKESDVTIFLMEVVLLSIEYFLYHRMHDVPKTIYEGLLIFHNEF